MVRYFDEVINKQYSELLAYAHHINNVCKKNRHVLTAISYAYINSQKHEPKTFEEAKRILLHYIKCELLYNESKTKKEKITAVEEVITQKSDEEKIHYDFHNIIDSELARFNFIERIFFEKYMEIKRNNGTIKDLAGYYKIDERYCRKKVKKLKLRINERVKD